MDIVNEIYVPVRKVGTMSFWYKVYVNIGI